MNTIKEMQIIVEEVPLEIHAHHSHWKEIYPV